MRAAARGIEEGFFKDVSVRAERLAASTFLTAFFVGAAYYVGSQIGFAIRFPSIPTSIVWLPNSILMAALMLSPLRRWWVYLLFALLAHLSAQIPSGVPTLTMFGLFLTNAGEAALGAFPVRRLCGGTPRFTRLRDLTIFLLFAVFIASFVTSFPDAAVVVLTGWGDDFSLVWQARFWSNVLTVLTLVPTVVLWATHGRQWLRGVSARRFAEACLLGAGLVAACALALSESGFGPNFAPALLYLPLLFLIWAALRFGLVGVSTSLFVVVTLTILFAVNGRGPFTSDAPAEAIFGIQLFLIAISIPILVLAAATDERSRATEELRASQDRNNDVLRAVPDLLFLNDAQGAYIDFYARDRSKFLVPPEQFLGKNLRDVLPPELARLFLWHFELALKTGEIRVFEYELVTQEGKGWYEARVVPSGHEKLLLTLVRDITERRQAEQALRDNQEFIETLLENFPGGIVNVLDREHRLILARGKGLADAGLHAEELVGEKIDELLREEEANFVWPFIERAFGGEHVDFEFTWAGKTYYLQAAPLQVERTSVRTIIVVAQNVTERRRAEEALKLLTGRLLKLQDEERRRIARELHDTTAQNLLAIVINLETLLEKAPDLPADFVGAIYDCQTLCQQTQSEIRTLSYLLHPPMLDEAGLILALEWFIEGFSTRSGIAVDFAPPSNFPRLSPQVETALFRIVQESLTNIYRHSGSKTAEIRLSRDDHQVRLEIRDHGLVTAADSRRPKPTFESPEGLGVGVAGMKERARQLGGQLDVSSNEEGTTVTAVLPVGEGEGI